MLSLYENVSLDCSKIVTQKYSTSFSFAIKTLDKSLHSPIFAIYGFVRLADEIVDTFHDFDKKALLEKLRNDTYQAIKDKISTNPIIHSFQAVVNKYDIEKELIDAFLNSMEYDLYENKYNEKDYNEYIYGSAEVVGLMCLRVFCNGDKELYDKLKAPAQSLGSAFQKVNFLRDIKSDYKDRGRVYFPNLDLYNFDMKTKLEIEKDIQRDFDKAYQGILGLPKTSKTGVYLAYIYYMSLFRKIQNLSTSKILIERVRIPNQTKLLLMLKTYFICKFNYL
ncbi:MAG: phytoene/squalene synthase family protein [Candidatus Sericytochromatia bacterium]